MAVSLLLLGFLVIGVDVLLSGPLTRLDWTVHLFADRHLDEAWWRWPAQVAKHVGHRIVVTAPLAVLCLVAAWRLRTIRPLVIVFVVCVALVIVVPGIKILTGRTPPRTGVDWMFTTGRIFPSGHAVNAIVLWGTFLELGASTFRRVRRWLPRRRIYAVITATGAAAGLGMVAMDYHWLTDVLAGWMLGAALFVTLMSIDPFRPLQRRRDSGAGDTCDDTAGEHESDTDSKNTGNEEDGSPEPSERR